MASTWPGLSARGRSAERLGGRSTIADIGRSSWAVTHAQVSSDLSAVTRCRREASE
jgi:hypothetical protein